MVCSLPGGDAFPSKTLPSCRIGRDAWDVAAYLPALAGGVIVVLAARLAALFGGRRAARVIAALAVAIAPVFMATNHISVGPHLTYGTAVPAQAVRNSWVFR
jgi:hypothetical protein